MLKSIGKDLLIDDADISTLIKYDIDVNNYKTARELQMAIDNLIDNEDLLDEEIDELDNISSKIQEMNYYRFTNK